MSEILVINRTTIYQAVFVFVLGALLSIQNIALADSTTPSERPSAAQVEELKQRLNLYHEAMNSRQYAEADILAKRIMELSIIVNGRDSVNSANALTNLALVQHRQNQYVFAILNYQAAIQTIEQIDGILSADLIRPLQGLGHTEMEMENIDRARDVFERAVHISHVNDGPRNPEQIESLNAIAETYLLTGYVKGALDIQQNIYALSARANGPESASFIPALQQHAQWMRKLGLYNRERAAYRQILSLQNKHLGESDLNMIPTLLALGMSRYNFGNVPWDTLYIPRAAGPDYYLRRASRIAIVQPESNWKLAADTAIAVGDYYTVTRRSARARYAYIEAWHRMSADPEGLSTRREQLEWPKLLQSPHLPEYYEDQMPLFEPTNTDNFLRGTITAEFDVSFSGKPVNIRLIESQPPGLIEIERRLVLTLKNLMHRPRFEDGSRVVTRQVTYTYEFYYRD